MANPKILVAVGDLLGCGYYRCVIPGQYLSENYNLDFRITNTIYPELAQEYDVIILQRQHNIGVLLNAKEYKNRRPDGKLIFEMDDNFHYLPKNNPVSKLYYAGSEATKNMEELLSICDLMTVSTESLKKEYSKFHKNIHVCYNSIDPSVFSELIEIEKVPNEGRIRIGWAGSSTHLDDFKEIMKPLCEIMYEYPNVDFVFIGQPMINLFPHNLRNRVKIMGDTFPRDEKGNPTQWADKNPTIEYYKLLIKSNLDIAIAPIAPIVFNSSKSFIKLIEYGIAKIPFVATSHGPYSQYISLNTNRELPIGRVASTNSEWKKHLKELIINENLRKSMAENNYNNVLNNHLIKNRANEWLKAYESINILPGDIKGAYLETINREQKVVQKVK